MTGRVEEGPLRILLVDDNRLNLFTLTEMLKRLGCSVEAAADGVEALEKLRPDHDLVLMDVSMPKLDGYETTRRIRSRTDALATIPVIALTGFTSASDREQCLEAGMNDCLCKPIMLELLKIKLEEWSGPGASDPG